MFRRALPVLLSTFFGLASPSLQATNGYLPHGYGTASKGMSGAGTALPQDTLSVFANPAGLTRLDQQFDVEVDFFMPHRKYRAKNDAAPPPVPSVPEGIWHSDNDLFLIPGFGLNMVVDEDTRIGIALLGQGGMNTDYDNPTFARFAAPPGSPQNPTGEFTPSEPTGVDLAQIGLGITYARNLTPITAAGITTHSIGITPILAAQRFKARGLQPFKGLSVAPDKITNNGYDYSYGGGLRIGWLANLFDRLDIGISYQTKLWMSDFDDYEGLFAKGGKFDIPPVLNIGLAFKLSPNITLLADYKRIYFSEIDALHNDNDVAFSELQTNPNKLLGADEGLGFGWGNVNVYHLGVQYDYGNKWTFRAGYSHGDEPWKNANTLFNVLAPATVQDHASVGVTYHLAKTSYIAAAFTHAFENKIHGTSTFTGPQTGYVSMYQNAFQISYGRQF